MKRIALFMLAPLTDGAGAEKYFVNLARNLRQRGAEADIITMEKKLIDKFAKWLYLFYYGKWFRHIDTSGRESEGYVKRQLGEANWIRTNFRNLGITLRKYDIVYSKNEIVDLILLKRLGYRNLPPIVVGVHTPLQYPEAKSFHAKLHNILYASFFYKWLLRGTKHVHVSNVSAKKFADEKFGLNSKLMYYPFSIQTIQKSAKNHKSEIIFDQGKKNIIFLGRLSEQKGIDVLINMIFEIARNKNLANNIRVNIFGSGDEINTEKIKKISEKYSFVKYFGHVENKYIPDILSQQDLMIAPYKWETLPYGILESQAMGIPVIAFDIPGPSDIIVNEKTGFLVKNKDEFAHKTLNFIEQGIIFNKEDIIENIKNKFDPDKIYEELLILFQETIDGKKNS